MTIVRDPNTKKAQKVNDNQRAYVHSVTVDEPLQATKKSRSYNINTGVITLTNATETPIMYFENQETEAFHITAIAVGVAPSTGGSGGIPVITIVRNPTTIDFSTAVDINSNRNYGSNNALTSDTLAYKGATGDTMSGGEDHLLFFQPSNGRLFASIDEVLPKGSKIGIKFDPQTGNTSQDVYCALIGHLEDPNE